MTLVFLIGCQSKESEKTTMEPAKKLLYDQGKQVYMTYCIACHNMDPKLPGATGPEVFGSAQNLLEARVLRAEYPKGYKPKRSTELMVEFEELKDDIIALHVFLNHK